MSSARLHDQRKAVGQIVARAAIEPHPLAIPAGDDPEAIVLDLMKPERSRRRAWGHHWQARRNIGKYGKSYIETDPSEADRVAIVRNMIDGQYNHPLRVIALNPAEGWSRDVSEEIAKAVVTAAEADDRVLTAGTSAFVETQRLRTLARLVDDSTKKGLVDPQRN